MYVPLWLKHTSEILEIISEKKLRVEGSSSSTNTTQQPQKQEMHGMQAFQRSSTYTTKNAMLMTTSNVYKQSGKNRYRLSTILTGRMYLDLQHFSGTGGISKFLSTT